MDKPRIAFIMVAPKIYEVNTVLANPVLELRNYMFGIGKMVGETMVWEVEPDDMSVRRNPIFHCQRYRTIEATDAGHKAVVNRLIDGDTSFFNGDGWLF